MATPMEFWGVEAKAKQPCEVELKEGSIIHVSQVTLGEIKKDKETVTVYVHVDGKKLVLAMLSQDTPQISCDLVFHEDFEISHTWKNGSVNLMGYQALMGEYGSDVDSSDEELDLPVAKENGQPAAKPKDANKPKPEEKDDSDEDDDSDDDEMTMGDIDESDESDDDDDDDDSEESEEEKPVQTAGASKKRAVAEAKTPPKSSKKAKIATPQKTDSKKGVVHPATPYPKKGEKTDSKKGESSKQKVGNTPAGDKTPTSGGSGVSCGSCKKTFKSESALQSHSKDKHGAK